MRTCVRCAECMKSCPTNTLQPCLWESGLTGLWTPKMDLQLEFQPDPGDDRFILERSGIKADEGRGAKEKAGRERGQPARPKGFL